MDIRNFTETHKKNLSIAHLGQTSWNKGLRGVQKGWNKGMKFPQYSKENSPVWKPKIKKICQICNKSYEVSPYREKSKFCSRECANKFLIGKPSWNKGKKNIYSEEILNKIREARKKQIITKETKEKMSIAHKDKTNSGQFKKGIIVWNKGLLGFQAGDKSPLWKGGISRQPYSFNFNEELKELIRKRDSYKCQICNAPQEEFTEKLPIHHKDYNKENSDPKNLITLCNSCHSKTNFNRKYWINYFQDKFQEVLNG